MRNVSWPRRPYTHCLRSVDVSARLGSHVACGATILRSRIVLDCEEWNSSERDARVWQSRIRRAHLEFGALRKDSPKERPSGERRPRALKAKSSRPTLLKYF